MDIDVIIIQAIRDYGKHDVIISHLNINRRKYFEVLRKLDILDLIYYKENRLCIREEKYDDYLRISAIQNDKTESEIDEGTEGGVQE